jgi:hypothetical protein
VASPLGRAKSPRVINALDQALRFLVLRSERIDYRVHSSPCSFHSAVRDVLRGNRRVLCHVPRRADRPRLNGDSANSEREND